MAASFRQCQIQEGGFTETTSLLEAQGSVKKIPTVLTMGQLECDNKAIKGTRRPGTMRGFFTAGGYYGLVNGKYVLFSDESEYYEYVREEE